MRSNEELVRLIKAKVDVNDNLSQLYSQNYRLIRKMALKYAGNEDPEDLEQEAFFGLLRAVELWDPEENALFMTYGIYWIKQVMVRYVSNYSTTIRIPVNQRVRIGAYHRAVNSYRLRFGKDPSPEEVCYLIGINRAQYEQLRKDMRTVSTRSTSEPIDADGETVLEDFIPAENDPIEAVVDKIQHEEFSRALWGLIDQVCTRQEAEVVRRRYLDGLTLKECGESLGVSIERVRQVESSALRKLRRPKSSKIIEPYLTKSAAFSFGLRSSLGAYRNNYTSAQEKALIILEEKTGPVWRDSWRTEWSLSGNEKTRTLRVF